MRRRETTGRRRAGFAGGAALALALAGGCGADEPDYGGPAPAHSAVEPHETAALPQPEVDLLGARDAVLEKQPEALVHDVELEEDSMEWLVEFTLDDLQRGAVVDAMSGDVVQDQELPHDDNDAPQWDLASLPEGSLDTAVAAALEESEGDRVVDASLSGKGDQLVWEIEVDDPDPADAGTETTVDVDAGTGDVLGTES
ncbi:PepSY domain-containing protein [Actinorugispora endophytica]|uniref:Peptidase YpeB-like protein n=1 Tax=Actinorugispora endophytica TaxID=1605990 RepID=A0A4R6UK04_9ACTN|nr:PepSY domain-containing protein [Actinorugispora endophytica]TDQ46882.1 peptidase YpeB-like protein [Actinorugispora endophytica]